MRLTCFLFVSSAGNVRVLKTDKGARPNEFVVRTEFEIPDAFFTRPIPVVRIRIPPEAVINPGADALVDVTADAVADALRVDATLVRDGLRDAVRMHNERNATDE